MKHRRPVRMIFAAAMAAFMALGMSPAVYAGGSEIPVSENGGIPAEQKLLQPAEESSLTEDGTSSEDSSAAEDGILVFACDGNGEYHLYKAPDFQSVKDKSYTEIVTPEGASINGNVLKLSGFHYETSAKVALYIAADFAGIRLSGSNSIVCSSQSTGTEESIFCRTLESEKDLMILGSGSLSLQAPAFDVTNDVTGYISSEALYAKGDLRVTENAAVEAKAGDISLKGSGYDDYGNAKALYVMSTGILCEGNMDVQRSAGITADAGKTNAESTAGTEENVLCEAQSAAIISYGSLSITDKAWIAATAQDSKRKGEASVRPPYGGSFGIMSEGNMTMSGKSLTAASGCTNEVSSIGINVRKDLNLNSGLVRTTADTAADPMEDEGSCGMYIEEKLTCNSADVFAMGADNGVIASDITAVVGTAKGCTEAGRGWDAADEAVTISLVNEKYGRYSFVTGDGHARTLVIRGMVTAGDNRYETAVNTANEVFPDGCSTVVLAAGANWPDALAASALAGANHCPILLTGRDYVTTETSDEIITLGVSKVFIVGGEDAMTRAVPEVLQDIGISEENIIRKSGDDRTQTADAVAAEVMQTGTSDTCFICSGNDFADAISVSSYAYRNQSPILLTKENGTLTEASAAIANQFSRVYIIGGEKAVSTKVGEQLASVRPVRIEGRDRFETNRKVISTLYPDGYSFVSIVTGENYPDGLTGSSLQDSSGSPVLLVDGNASSLTEDQIRIIRARTDKEKVGVLGGSAVISSQMRQAIQTAAFG
jgi:putative cell wall-binding protein